MRIVLAVLVWSLAIWVGFQANGPIDGHTLLAMLITILGSAIALPDEWWFEE